MDRYDLSPDDRAKFDAIDGVHTAEWAEKALKHMLWLTENGRGVKEAYTITLKTFCDDRKAHWTAQLKKVTDKEG